MGLFDNINSKTGSTINPDIKTNGFEFKKLCDLVGQEFKVFGFLTTKGGKFGRSTALVTDKFFISLPKRYTEVFDEATPEEIEELKAGTKKITGIQKIDSKNGETTVFQLVDC